MADRTAYHHAYYLKHRERLRAQRRAWWHANREERCAKQRVYRAAHRFERKLVRELGIPSAAARALIEQQGLR